MDNGRVGRPGRTAICDHGTFRAGDQRDRTNGVIPPFLALQVRDAFTEGVPLPWPFEILRHCLDPVQTQWANSPVWSHWPFPNKSAYYNSWYIEMMEACYHATKVYSTPMENWTGEQIDYNKKLLKDIKRLRELQTAKENVERLKRVVDLTDRK